MDDEMCKSVDTAADAVNQALFLLHNMQKEIQYVRGLADATEKSDCEFKYARMAGQMIGLIDSTTIMAEVLEIRILDAQSALLNLRGEI